MPAHHRGWRTAQPDLRVLLVIHSTVAATRLHDLLPILTDRRIQVFCVTTEGAVFPAGVDDFIHDAGFHHISWAQATTAHFDVAITASLGDNLHTLTAKILRIPHGNGYNKRWSRESGVGSRESGAGSREPGENVFGLSADTLTHDGRIIPTAIGLSHHEQRDRLATHFPEALPRAFLAGDPCYDRLLASTPQRAHYRRAFGLRPGQRLLVVNSTWRENSLYGAHPELPERLLAELPLDEYRVALILHPNAWSAHSERQIRLWLDDARRAGLLLIPPREGWRAAIIAADDVISDCGSVSVYAAALGRPLLLATDDRARVATNSALGRLLEVAVELRPLAAITSQLHAARDARDTTTKVAATWASSAPGRSLDLIRGALYELLGAAEPEGAPRVLAVPEPSLDTTSPSATWVDPRWIGESSVRVRRFPAALRRPRSAVTASLVVADTEPDQRLAIRADVVHLPWRELPAPEPEWSAEVYTHRPGAALTLVHDEVTATLRDRHGAAVTVTLIDPAGAHAPLVFTTLAVLAHRTRDPVAFLRDLPPLTVHAGDDIVLTVEAKTV